MALPLTDADFAAEYDADAARLNQMARDAAELGIVIDCEEGPPEELDEDGALIGTEPLPDPEMEDTGE